MKKNRNIVIKIFLFFIFAIYPFYIENGYDGIDSAKNEFLFLCLLFFIPLMLIARIIKWLSDSIANKKLTDKNVIRSRVSLDCVDFFMALYVIVIVIATYNADNRKIAFWGYQGWYMGGILILALALVYYLISSSYRAGDIMIYIILTASVLVFILGILNRFDIWPIPIKVESQYSYLSTLGNIGWYCGYLSVIAPIGLSLFVLKKNQSRLEHILYGLYVFIVCMTGLSQEADGIFIIFAVSFTLIAALAANRGEREIKNYFEMIMIWALTGQVIHFLRAVFPENYQTDSTISLCTVFNNTFITLIILFLVIGLYYYLYRKNLFTSALLKRLMTLMPVFFIIFFMVWIIVSLLAGDPHWGNGRGAAMRTGLLIYKDLPVFNKLFGVGPDCFGVYYKGSLELKQYVAYIFGNSTLTNAHNELITNMVNIGLLGTIAFYGLAIAFIIRCYRLGSNIDNAKLLALITCVASYLLFNILNYAQILNYPFYILLIAIGEGWIKEDAA